MENQQLMGVINKAIDRFHGDATQLESAIGALIIGQHMGSKVMMLVHSRATLKSYSKILLVPDVRKLMPPLGPLSHRSLAWRLVEGTNKFWKAVRGELTGIKSTQLEL